MKAVTKKKILQILLLVISLLFIYWGINRREVQIVLQKAITICLECIGLG